MSRFRNTIKTTLVVFFLCLIGTFANSQTEKKTLNFYVIPIDIQVNKSLFHGVKLPFQSATVQTNLFLFPSFHFPNSTIWDNPPADGMRFSRQMKKLRENYFASYPSRDPTGVFIFLIKQFQNDSLNAFSFQGSGIGFVKYSEDSLLENITQLIGIQLGDSTLKTVPDEFSPNYYDNYEFIKTNNGLVAYTFWNQDAEGNIEIDSLHPLSAVYRPFKRNHLYYSLKVDNPFFRPLFQVYGKSICGLHLSGIALSLLLVFLIRRIVNRRIKEAKFLKRQSLRLIKLTAWVGGIAIVVGSFYLVSWIYEISIIGSTHLKAFNGMERNELIQSFQNSDLFTKRIKRKCRQFTFKNVNGDWFAKTEKRVLYFDLFPNESGYKAKFISSDNHLRFHNKITWAAGHYFVFRYRNVLGDCVLERVFNHQGVELTDKLELADPPKRILIFVNGYRPVSTAQTISESWNEIQKKGIEFPETRNYLYDYDRFNYWRPWNQIDLLFQKRINPSEVWYADGHHSVATSNHRSIINFTTNAGFYPKNCKRSKHKCSHTTVAGKKKVETLSLLATESNQKGFDLRRKNGRIAGSNMYQILNELPNRSANDTLFIVAHSMGYAYALGMIDVLKKHVQLGGLYIIAPENANAGSVNKSNWKEVWQYGANFKGTAANFPCEQDGVAVQYCAGGISEKERCYFPKEKRSRMGYFSSHFIGNYTWILDIPAEEKGGIRQR